MDEMTPLTREQVQTEIGNAMTDKAHPQHSNYRSNPEAWGQFADNLYKRVPVEKGTDGKDLVVIDEGGIQIGGTPPEADETRQQYHEVHAALATSWGDETTSRINNVKSYIETFDPAEREAMFSAAEQLGDVAAIRLLDSIIRKMNGGAKR